MTWFGLGDGRTPDESTLLADDVRLTLDGTEFDVLHGDRRYPVRLRILGEHHALNAVATNRARVDYIEREYLSNAQESRDIVLASYRLGVANLIDFLDAQRAFRDTQRIYNRALFDQRVSLFELAAAVGRPEAQP